MEGLVSKSEHAALARSTQYAHYTPELIIRAIWDGLTRLGFRGGHILEPGCGIGLFLSLQPEPLRSLCRITGIEADPVTARIARQLLPEADIRTEDFALTRLESGYALAVGNPPFSSRVVNGDPRYRSAGYRLHDFFIVKALDHVLPGGLAAFVTSQGTMDKADASVRRRLASVADLMGAIRLPAGAFRESAGTEVGVDVLFFRKRMADESPVAPIWTETRAGVIAGHPKIAINRYFLAHPSMVLGQHSAARGPYGPDPVYTCRAYPGELDARLSAAIANLPKDVATCDSGVGLARVDAVRPAPAVNDNDRLREGSYFVSADGVLMQVIDGAGQAVPLRAPGVTGLVGKHAGLIRALIPIRDAVRAVLALQEGRKDSAAAQARLGDLYDVFVARHGAINFTTIQERIADDGTRHETHRQPNLEPFRDDPDCWLVASIEHYDLESGNATKALIFTGTVIAHQPEPAIQSASDALARCLHELGFVDVPRIAQLRGTAEAGVVDELGDLIYLDPDSESWVTADEYLSGTVRVKLAAARQAAAIDPAYARNVAALEAVQPSDIPPSDITARLGAPWIPVDVVTRFAREVMRVHSAEVGHAPEVASWSINARAFSGDAQANARWGTHRYDCGKVLLDALNAHIPAIYDEEPNDRGTMSRVLNAIETEAAKEKLAILKGLFQEWVWQDPAQCDRLARIYNDNFNDLVTRRFDGGHLRLPGASSEFQLRPHQKNAIWRVLAAGSTYLAHAVGAGKSAALAAAVLEQRRLGLVHKPIIAVPGHCLVQFAREFLTLYPLARILVADEQNFARDRRRRFLARAATGAWDAIVITHAAFKLIPIPIDFERRMIREMIDEYEAVLLDIPEHERLTRKRVEAMKEGFEKKLNLLSDRKDDFLTLSEIGIDQIIPDEAHEYRKLSFTSSMSTLKGIDPNGSQLSWDLYAKIRFVRALRAERAGVAAEAVDRAVIMSSGTPITNTLGEMFTIQRFMDPVRLRARNLHEFDAWASSFGETRTELELQASGRYKPVTRFAEFVNVPELIAMFRSVADVVSADDLKKLVRRPPIRGGRREIIAVPPSDGFRDYQEVLADRIEAIEARGGPPQKGDDILLSVITDGRHAAIDMRFVVPGHDDEPDNKLNRMVREVHRIWKETAAETYLDPFGKPFERPGATQMIFSDLGTPAAFEKRGFSAYLWARHRLIALGVPAAEIAFVHDFKGAKAKARLFADMRAGKVRIVLGSTKKMGTGVNAQNRLKALHHLDVPWLPSDIEQREGRIDRQGNQNAEIELYAYATEGSMDAQMWQTNERKARFIAAALSGDRSVRRIEDVGESSADQFALAKAIASGDPRLMQKAGLEADITRLERLRSAHSDEQHRFRSRLASARHAIEEDLRVIPLLEADVARLPPEDTPFVITVGDAEFTDRKFAGKALTTAMRTINQEVMARYVRGQGIVDRPIATFRGFDIVYTSRATSDGSIVADCRIQTTGLWLSLTTRANTPGVVAIGQVEEALDALPGRLQSRRENLAYYENLVRGTEPSIGKAFDLQGELDRKRAALEAIDADLARANAAA
ncbi:hypothetical protein HPGCJGGD_3344 [Methylobacterium haplocladii]|nr:N-6 DNA methylase [Methylobacterium haplocladii]GJD85455.1 hypothetical protein HPGCJGGD_3344 [Methylobacterium haplocladii]